MGCIDKLSAVHHRIFRKQFALWTAGLGLAGLTLFAVQAALITVPGFVKLTPLSVSAQSSQSLPPEVQALEAETATLVFDRNTTTEYVAFDEGHIEAQLAAEADINHIKIFGPARYTLTVKAPHGGSWQTVDGLSNIKLANQSANWNTFAARTPVTTNKLRFELTPDNGGGKNNGKNSNAASGLKEIEIWSNGERHLLASATALVSAMQDDKMPAQVSEHVAVPAEAAVTATGPQSFSLTLERNPTDIKRAYLAYETFGFNHWVSPARAINDLPVQGGDFHFTDLSWSSQVEPINPAWLKAGQNTVNFSLPAGMTGSYSVRNVRLLTELDDGGNFIASVDSNTDAALAGQVVDADLATGWAPYDNRSRGKTDKPNLSLYFDKPTQVDGLALYLTDALDGTLTLAFLRDGNWVSGGATVNGRKFVSGWNQLDAASAGAVTALRLTFENGAGSAAEIRELNAIGSGVGPTYMPRLVVSYPDAGQYFGRRAYIRGYLELFDNGSGTAELFVGGKPVAHSDGAFGVVISKEDVGLDNQSDADPWSVDINAVYPDASTVTTTVYLNNEGDISQSQGSLPTVVTPGATQIMKHDGAELDVDADALDEPVEIKIKSLGTDELPPLDPGMTNVTKGPRKGYRFTPHGQKFKKKIKVKLPYDRNKVPDGLTENEVNTYYFDEELSRWVRLEREKLDRNKQVVTALTDHFTDMINATLVVPDHPQIGSFNPTQIKDIKAADPGTNINLIEPPQANNMGDARLSYPIDVPPGRNGLQPQIAVNYNSSGSNGWMGMGWDMPMQAVTIEARWGVPRYDLNKETETYMFNGQQLTPVAHRGVLKNRSDDTTVINGETVKVFHTRIEGQFRKIIRHGTNPKTYWWEVIDKNGTRSFYGGGPDTGGPTTNSTLVDANGNVNMWSLRIIRDTNDNFVKYRCVRLNDNGLPGGTEPGTSLYLTSITYTGNGSQEGSYKVEFKRDRDLNEPRRRDITIDARGGFKKVTGDLLRQVDVSLGSNLIRRYEFKYDENPYGDNRPPNAFNKTLLTAIVQFGEDGVTEFNRHDFTYIDEARDENGNYNGFQSSSNWVVGNDNISANLLGRGLASTLGGSQSTSTGGHIYIGVGSAGDTSSKQATGGLKVGYSESDSETLITLADMNGDGLPDKVFQGSGGIRYRPNLSGPAGEHRYGPAVQLPTLSRISRESVTSTTIGGELYFGLPVMFDRNSVTSETEAYFGDVNGDGLTDLINGGSVVFGYINAAGVPTFSANSADTPLPIGAGVVNTDGLLEDAGDIEAERAKAYPLLDTVRQWVAPYDGVVSITAPVRLIEDTSERRVQYDGADGVRVAIQLEGAELWSTSIAAENYNLRMPTGVSSVPVQRGDRLYFRVQSVFDGAYDQVAWNPEIVYLGSNTARTDVNNLTVFRYLHSQDFTLAGRSGTLTVPITGTLHLGGTWKKTGPTTDDVTLLITHNGSEIYRRTLGFADTEVVDLSQDIDVTLRDQLAWRILVDSPIDPTLIQLAPTAHYTAAEGVDSVTDDQGNFVLQVQAPYGMDLYPRNALTAPQGHYLVTVAGTKQVQAKLLFNAIAPGREVKAFFTIKRRGALLNKQEINIVGTGLPIEKIVNTTVDAMLNDELFFDVSSRDVTFPSLLSSLEVRIGTSIPLSTIVPAAVHTPVVGNLLPQPHRGWGVFGYNGNSPRATQPIDQSLLVLDNSYDPENGRVYPFVPIPSAELWGGIDELAWIRAAEMSSSRLGLDDIRMPSSEQFAGAAAVARISRSTNNSVSVGITGAEGDSRSQLDFQDLNGDRFPDVIGHNGVQYTRMDGGLESGRRNPGLGSARESENTTFGVSTDGAGNIARAIASGRGNVAPDGQKSAETSSQGMDMPSLGFSANIGIGTSDAEHDLIDINGDSLADKVFRNGTVALNLGYRFGSVEPWGGGIINEGRSLDAGGGVNLGFNQDWYSIAGGLSLTIGETKSNETYTDINGDGLPDKIVAGSPYKVRLNTGAGFTSAIDWPGGHGGVASDKHISLGGGGYFTFGFNVLLVRIVINPGLHASTSMGRPEIAFRDIDGDSYADHLFSSKASELKVALNPIGRTNLLKKVSRPLGATFDISYKRSGNTYEQPQSRWVMEKVVVFDGVEGDTPAAVSEKGADYQVMKFDYKDGFHDRYEREFYGFKKVTETQFNTSGLVLEELDQANDYRRIVRTFLNDSFYTKGLILVERTEDMQSVTPTLYFENVYIYELRDVFTRGLRAVTPGSSAELDGTSLTLFPELRKTERKFFEGEQIAGKTTFMTHQYDQYGNATEYFDDAEPGVDEDNVLATISYTDSLPTCLDNYIVGKPRTITVKGNGKIMREREGEFDCSNGNLLKLKQKLEGNKGTAETVLGYDSANGNLVFVQGPRNQRGERYELFFGYDNKVQTHINSIRNSFTYESVANFTEDSLKYGKPESTTDLNGNTISYVYDRFGRTERVTGPYEQDNTDAFTLKFSYDHNAIVPWARTQHYDKDAANQTKDSIDTILLADGLKRVLQTKKDATIRGGDKMIVSGRVAFDHVGRIVRQYYPTSEIKAVNTGFTREPDDTAKPTVMRYDVLDRNLYTEIPDTTATSFEYDIDTTLNRFRTLVIDAENNKKETYRDVRELVTRVIEFNPKGNQPQITTNYVYDALKQITDVIDDKGNLTKVAYDNFGRRTRIDNPDIGLTKMRYDLASNVIKKITANLHDQGMTEGREVAINYNYEFNRLKSITYPNFTGNNVVYEYGGVELKGKGSNRVGRVIEVNDQSGTEERFYGKLGEITKEIKTVASETQGNSSNSPEVYTTEYIHDTFGRLLTLNLPDGEILTHTYDSGGNVTTIEGGKRGDHYIYLERMDYDRFEQRVFARFGNGIETRYEYRDDNRRLLHLNAGKPQSQGFQQLEYVYDTVGSITDFYNHAPEGTTNGMGGTTEQHFTYDNLYRLTTANGVYKYAPKRQHQYTLSMRYDSIHNIEHKDQRHWRTNPGGSELEQKGTTYQWDYAYGGTQPHAPTHIGNRGFTYDANGNQLGWTNDNNGQRRAITWDEENRIQAIADNGQTTRFKYNDQGQRVFKIGQQGETAYINQFYTVRNRSIATKHVFAGTLRIASRLAGGNGNTRVPAPGTGNGNGNGNTDKTNNGNAYGHDKQASANGTPFTSGHPGQGLGNRSDKSQGKNADKNPHLSGTHPGQGLDNRSATANEHAQNTNKNPHLVGTGGGDTGGSPGGSTWKPEENFLYFYHSDHLGSTGYVTDKDGEIYEHIEYFPFGETWVQEASNTERTPYLFSSKELDQETGLYYYGARYYDPRTSVWQSADPILGKYLDGSPSNGVFDSKNMSLYAYTHNNPVNLTDPNGTCTNDPLCAGNWGASSASFSPNQDFEAVQDQFNFGSGPYNADPQVWQMDESVDIGTQIQTSVNNPQGAMNNVYQQGKANIGKPMPFTWNRKSFNSDPSAALNTAAWPFGRVSGNVAGTMTVNKDGTYLVQATLQMNSDDYSWNPDGSGIRHNLGISILGNNFNSPGIGNLQHASVTSQQRLNFPYINNFNLADTMKGGPAGSVRWSAPSAAYQQTTGEMPVNYPRVYNFSATGTGK